MGFRTTQMIYVAAKLGIADHFAEGPQTADALAQAVGAAPRPLYRLLRALASIGIFAETPRGSLRDHADRPASAKQRDWIAADDRVALRR